MSETKSPPEAVAAINSTDHVTIKLDCPLQRGEQKISELTLRKPKAGQLRGLDIQDLMTGDVNALLVVIPRISSPAIVTAEAEQLDMTDLGQITGAIRGFFMSKEEMGTLERYLGIGESQEHSTE